MLKFEDYTGVREAFRKSGAVGDNVCAVLGAGEDGKAFRHTFGDGKGNLIISGVPGSGSFNSVYTILFDLLKSYKDDKLHISVTDLTLVGEYDMFTINRPRYACGFEYHTTYNTNHIVSLLDSAIKDIEEQIASGKNDKPNVVVISGLHKVYGQCTKNKWSQILSKLSYILSKCCSKNIYLVIASPDLPDYFTSAIIKKFDSKLVLRANEPMIDRMGVDSAKYVFDELFGTGYYVIGEQYTKLNLTSVPNVVWKEL